MKKKNKKLLIVVSSAKFFLSHRLSLALAAKRSGYDVHIATPLCGLVSEIKKTGLHYHKILMSRGSVNPYCDLKTVFSLYRLYKQLSPDIVHHVAMKPILYGSLVARIAKIPAVLNTFSGLGYLFIAQSFPIRVLRCILNRFFRLGFRHSNLTVIFQNLDDQAYFLKAKIALPKQTLIIPGSGVAMKDFSPSPESEKEVFVVLASRMLWDKGILEFVDAARALKKRYSFARFILVGDTDHANPAAVPESQLNVWAKEGSVEWWGWRDDMHKIMASSHIVCLPSYREGLPRVLVEAAASARAIVTTDAPGCRDVVSDGENGFLVPPKNSEALAEAIENLLKDPVLRRQMGKRGRQIAEEKFSLSLVLEKNLQAYSNLLSQVQ